MDRSRFVDFKLVSLYVLTLCPACIGVSCVVAAVEIGLLVLVLRL